MNEFLLIQAVNELKTEVEEKHKLGKYNKVCNGIEKERTTLTRS